MNDEQFRLEIYGTNNPVFVDSKMPGSSLPWAKTPVPKIKQAITTLVNDDSFSESLLNPSLSIEMGQVYFGYHLSKSPSFPLQMDFLLSKAPLAKSWMITDFVPQYLKKGSAKAFKPYFLKLVNSKDDFSRRLAYVIALHFYRDKDIGYVYSSFKKDDRYYVMMSEAWLLASLAIYDFSRVKSLLLSNKLTNECKKKTISKMIDSFRIDEKMKNEAREIRQSIESF